MKKKSNIKINLDKVTVGYKGTTPEFLYVELKSFFDSIKGIKCSFSVKYELKFLKVLIPQKKAKLDGKLIYGLTDKLT